MTQLRWEDRVKRDVINDNKDKEWKKRAANRYCGIYDFVGEGMAVVHYSRYCAVDTVHTHVVHCVVDPAVRPVVTEVTVDR